MNTRKTFVSAALIVALSGVLLLAAAADASASGPAGFYPVGTVAIQPSPFHMDEPVMRVVFRATVPAPAGYRYFLSWQTLAPLSTLPASCAPSSDANPVGYRGGGTVTATLRPEAVLGDAFCPGRSTLTILLQRSAPNGHLAKDADVSTLRKVTSVSFRVLRP